MTIGPTDLTVDPENLVSFDVFDITICERITTQNLVHNEYGEE